MIWTFYSQYRHTVVRKQAILLLYKEYYLLQIHSILVKLEEVKGI